MAKSEDIPAKLKDAIEQINLKVNELERSLLMMALTSSNAVEQKVRRLRAEIDTHLQVLDDIITELLEGKD